MPEELVALYDPDDVLGRVTGAAPRSRVRAANLPHAATGVLVRRGDGRILVHRRSGAKDLWPGAHDAACGGVVQAGESPRQAAVRELAEEVGVRAAPEDLNELVTAWYRDRQTHYLAHVYETVWDGEIRFADDEVAQAWWWTEEQLRDRLADPHWSFVPDTRYLMRMLEPAVADAGPWPAGATALYRLGRQGRAGFVRPGTVVHDGPDELVVWIAAGTPTVRQVYVDGRELREPPLEERAGLTRIRRMGSWHSHGIYLRFPAGRSGWSLWHFFADDGGFHGWYANLEAPQVRRRTALGSLLVDTADRALDVWVPRVEGRPDPRWKDEDEFAAFTDEPGRWTAAQVPGIVADGDRLFELARAGLPPFDGAWTTPPDPMPPPPVFPPDWDLPHVAGP